ncbi:MAG: response regulator transcription factor [Bacteroidetes bacterium]|nr:response regulator transcription factor [Bacteroidota bacterium]
MRFTIALAEDNTINRNTFLQKIALLGNMDVAFVATNGNQCLKELRGMHPAKLPQVMFMDLEMPEMDGIQTIRLAKSMFRDIHFIILTVFDDDDRIFEAIKAGASGYLLKHEPANVLEEAVINVLEYGGAPMSPAIARKALQLLGKSSFKAATTPVKKMAVPDIITSREEEILKYMVAGWDAKKIASILDISINTVRNHIANIYEKLHVQSHPEVINMAHHNKWFEE